MSKTFEVRWEVIQQHGNTPREAAELVWESFDLGNSLLTSWPVLSVYDEDGNFLQQVNMTEKT